MLKKTIYELKNRKKKPKKQNKIKKPKKNQKKKKNHYLWLRKTIYGLNKTFYGFGFDEISAEYVNYLQRIKGQAHIGE